MASLADGITVLKDLGFYHTLFPFLLILAVMYGVLSKLKPFGDHKTINIVVSFIVAMFFIALTRTSLFLASLIPYVTGFLVVLLFIVLIFMFMGVPAENIKEAMLQPQGYGTILVLFIIIIFIVLSQTYPETALVGQPELAEEYNVTQPEEGTEGLAYYLGVQATALIFSPTVLGLILLLALFGIATYYITREKNAK